MLLFCLVRGTTLAGVPKTYYEMQVTDMQNTVLVFVYMSNT